MQRSLRKKLQTPNKFVNYSEKFVISHQKIFRPAKSFLSLNATFSVVFLIIVAVLTQICMTLKVVVYLNERRDKQVFVKSRLIVLSKPFRYLGNQKQVELPISLVYIVLLNGKSAIKTGFNRYLIRRTR